MNTQNEKSKSMIPYLHVNSVRASITFYSLLGMSILSVYGEEADPFWAMMGGEDGRLMLARASAPIDPRVQAAMLYRYSTNVQALREHLIANGIPSSGPYKGDHEDAFPPQGRVYGILHPGHMPEGELRLHDPDGYVILVGQLDDSPQK